MSRFAYLFSKFPLLSTTFIQHQVKATQNYGLDASLVATRNPKTGNYHPEDKELIETTIYLDTIDYFTYLKAGVRIIYKRPLKFLKAIKLAFILRDDFPWQRIKNLIHLAGAIFLADLFISKSISHVHVHFAFGAAGIAIFLKTLTDISYSISIHGSDVLLPRPLTEEKIRRACFIVSNCKFHVRNLRKRFPSLLKQKFYIVYGGVDLQLGPWSESIPCRSSLPLRLLNVARLEPVKGHEILIEACALLKKNGVDFLCRIVGDGSKRRELETLIKNLNLHNHIELTGSCYQDKVCEFYEWSNIVVLSSLSEGTPMTIIEAMAKARAVVAPDISAIPEMVIDGITGFLFRKGSSKDLADKLTKLERDNESIVRMGLEGRKKAEIQFDLKRNAKRLCSIYGKEIPNIEINSLEEVEYE
jgi:glycosyltransferase involved in cell wall biosynthesis